MNKLITRTMIQLIRNTFFIILILLNTQNLKAQDVIWLEAEKFDNFGGWTNDWQFIDQMGSPYLMATGLGSPVEDAQTAFNVNKPGKYRIWIRTLDWMTDHHPGRFIIIVNNLEIDKIFGENGEKGWTWEDGGIVDLKTNNELILRDLTGYYGRCDVVVFSQDLDWEPSSEMEALTDMRLKYGAISKEISDKGSYDVVVIGGGIAGTLAAVSAAREGAKTVLIQNRGQLGGNASHELLIPPVGTVSMNLTERQKIEGVFSETKGTEIYDPRETGLIEEIANYGDQSYFDAGKYYPGRLMRLVQGEPNLDLFLYTHAVDVIMKNHSEIEKVICVTVPEGKRLSFSGKIFIDCTGNGIIGVKSGADYLYGRESKEMYKETKAPDQADTTVLPASLKYWYEESKTPQSFIGPSWAYSFHECRDFGEGRIGDNRHPKLGKIDYQWVIELGGTDRPYENSEILRDRLFRLIYGIWDHVKNHCPVLEKEAEKLNLVWVGHVIGMRESYRLKGDYVMSERDVTEQPLLHDRIAYGGWGLDDHPSEGFFNNNMLNDHTHRGLLHSIPYRSLYSRNINNLMMAGRNISVTQVALTATRVMLTTGVIGQAAGMAAGMCIDKEVMPRDIYNIYSSELQQKLLKTGAYLIELPNMDPYDIALLAKASASSEHTPALMVNNGFSRATLPSVSPGAEYRHNAWIPDFNTSEPHWVALNWKKLQQFNVVHVVFQNRNELAPKSFRLEIKKGKDWEPLLEINNSRGFRRLVIPFDMLTTKDLRVVLTDKNCEGGICEIRVYNENFNTIQNIIRSNTLMQIGDGDIFLPWEIAN